MSFDIYVIFFLVLLCYEIVDDLEFFDMFYVRFCFRVCFYKYYIFLFFNIFMGGNGFI